MSVFVRLPHYLSGKLRNVSLTLYLGFLCFGLAHAETVTIAVASNFLGPAKSLAEQFELNTGHTVVISAGSTGKLYAQIIHGAPYDILLAANAREPQRLEKENLIVPGSRFTYALGQLVLWSPSPDLFKSHGERVFVKNDFDLVSIANPKTAPYGAAAMQVISKYYRLARPFRIVRGENVGQAYQYVRSGNVQVGFVALSQILSDKSQQGSYWRIPQSDYLPIKQQAVVLKRAEQSLAARAFMDFLKSSMVKERLAAEFGYALEDDTLNKQAMLLW